MTAPKIAFCTTCKGRVQHLAETLPKNLADNAGYPCVFVVLVYGDPETSRYLSTRHQADIKTGRLVVYDHPAANGFHVSHAKNMAARCGIMEGAEILVTLDADNFTRAGFAPGGVVLTPFSQWIADQFQRAKCPDFGMFLCPDFPLIQNLPHGPKRPLRGFAGRLAIRSQDFIKMGGYDESFDTWRGEDIDMISRLQRLGYAMRHIDVSYLGVIPHNAEVRFKEYPHARQYENKHEVRNIGARTVTVANYGRYGIGKVHRNFSATPVELEPLPTRIFGIGMHKTGTTSLDAAFKILGFDSFHWGTGQSPVIWRQMKSAGRSPMLERWYALCDLPIPLLYRELDRAYPGSKFILTERDEGDWLRSVERLWDARFNPTRWVWNKYPFTNHIHTALYGRTDFDAPTFLARYRQHNAEVKAYFKDRPRDLLVMSEPAWPSLCAFLGAMVPGVPYPKANSTRDLQAEQPECSETITMTVESQAYAQWVGSSPYYEHEGHRSGKKKRRKKRLKRLRKQRSGCRPFRDRGAGI